MINYASLGGKNCTLSCFLKHYLYSIRYRILVVWNKFINFFFVSENYKSVLMNSYFVVFYFLSTKSSIHFHCTSNIFNKKSQFLWINFMKFSILIEHTDISADFIGNSFICCLLLSFIRLWQVYFPQNLLFL